MVVTRTRESIWTGGHIGELRSKEARGVSAEDGIITLARYAIDAEGFA
jgi:hypothetical protein